MLIRKWFLAALVGGVTQIAGAESVAPPPRVFTPAYLHEYLDGRKLDLLVCYQHITANPKAAKELPGRIDFSAALQIDGKAKIDKVDFSSLKVHEPALEKCLADHLKTDLGAFVKMPAGKGASYNAKISLSRYLMQFTTDQDAPAVTVEEPMIKIAVPKAAAAGLEQALKGFHLPGPQEFDGSWIAALYYSGHPKHAIVGDFNGDGRQDLAFFVVEDDTPARGAVLVVDSQATGYAVRRIPLKSLAFSELTAEKKCKGGKPCLGISLGETGRRDYLWDGKSYLRQPE